MVASVQSKAMVIGNVTGNVTVVQVITGKVILKINSNHLSC